MECEVPILGYIYFNSILKRKKIIIRVYYSYKSNNMYNCESTNCGETIRNHSRARGICSLFQKGLFISP